jgi:cytochrome c553
MNFTGLTAITGVLLAGAIVGGAGPITPEDVAWAFPPAAAADAPPGTRPSTKPKMVRPPGVAPSKLETETRNIGRAVDWRPAEHAPMPAAVAGTGREGALACGYCHLPDGQGRPENASLAGLPADYLLTQVAAFAKDQRGENAGPRSPAALMHQAALQVTSEEIADAAAYFAKVKYVSRIKVTEAATIPKVLAGNSIYHLSPAGGREPLGQRIIEVPDNFEQFELRDGHGAYTAYVPPGAVGRGLAFSASGGGGKSLPCESCHGAGLKGGPIAPPLAGRSPSYLFRQLYLMQTGNRKNPRSILMGPVVRQMTMADMIDVSAYAGSLTP